MVKVRSMRVALHVRTFGVLVLVIALCGLAGAQPKRGPLPKKAPPPAKVPEGKQAEIDKLNLELNILQGKQATFAMVKLARKIYELQKKLSGEEDMRTTSAKQRLAGILQQAGDYAEALRLYREMLKATEKKHGAQSREVSYSLLSLIGLYWGLQQYEQLEPLYQRSLAISKKLDGEKSQGYASTLSQYGSYLFSRNEYSAAQRTFEQVLKIQESIAPAKDDYSTLGALQMLGNLLWQTNQHQKAIAMFDRAIAVSAKAQYSQIMMQGSTMMSVASIYHYGGRDDLAKPLQKKVVDLYQKEIDRLEKNKGQDWEISSLLGQLGFIQRQNGDLVAAEKTLEKAIAIDKKRGGFSGWATTIAEIKRAQGKPKEALALYEKAAADLAKIAPQSATAYNTIIADVLREVGEYQRAEKLLLAYRAQMEKQFGKKHPIIGYSMLSLSYVYMGMKQWGKAEQLLDQSLDIAEKELSLVLKTGTESDHTVYFSRNNYQLDTAINFHAKMAPKSPAAARLALTTLLRRKGRVLDAAASSLATVRSKLSPEDKKLLDELATARAKLAKLTVAGPTATGEDDYAQALAALEDEVHKLELAISKKSAAYRAASQKIELKPIQKAIPRDAKLVEIVNYQPYTPGAPYNPAAKFDPRRYGAFVLAQTGDPVFVDLGPVTPIEEAIAKFRTAVADPDNDGVTELGKKLYGLTIAKIRPALGNTSNILIAPDGALNIVPFSALVDDKGQFLVKKFTFTYFTSGRDLLRLHLKSKPKGGGVIFADPSFDGSDAAKPKQPAAAGGTRGRRSRALASLSWAPLPGTGQEADELLKVTKGMKVFRGKQATENALKQISGPRVLHLATHGFFLTDDAPPAGTTAKPDAAGGPAPAPAPRATPAGPGGGPAPSMEPTQENPLLRSGLALAGANKLESGEEDGIVTAMEASGLDLWGTKLVVLSACETGVGKVTNGEGVYGLRRALVIAGAESMVMTLWQVDDLATRDLMAGYYKRLEAGKGRSSALRDVQLEISGQAKYAHPYYWASFLPAGDNSPLKE
jgi:CHAT domain-containing protein/Tfp pilus assembly protein PilF